MSSYGLFEAFLKEIESSLQHESLGIVPGVRSETRLLLDEEYRNTVPLEQYLDDLETFMEVYNIVRETYGDRAAEFLFGISPREMDEAYKRLFC